MLFVGWHFFGGRRRKIGGRCTHKKRRWRRKRECELEKNVCLAKTDEFASEFKRFNDRQTN
jgi:hypothetical protein